MHIHYLQHVAYEGPAQVLTWAKSKGHQVTHSLLCDGEPLLSPDQFDMLVIMGGPMSAYEEDKYPWLKPEKELIKKAIEANKVVLGLCLGAQLIADVLGGKVYRHKYKEIGWHPVHLNEHKKQSKIFADWEDTMIPFHWHGDTFDLPEGCVRVAESEGCLNQAFFYKDRVFGLQFHLEFDELTIQRLIDRDRDQLNQGRYIQSEADMLKEKKRISQANDRLISVLNSIEEEFFAKKSGE